MNQSKKKKLWKRIIKACGVAIFILILTALFIPTWTPNIYGENSISELCEIEVNGTALTAMIRGEDRTNPVIVFVHGGPCCSEIPYVRKYQDLLEKDFTIVHYDQRGSGKSYHFGKDYSNVTAATHVEDLITFTEWVENYLNQDKVIVIGHSFGTYIATLAASQRPDLYQAYVGIGQMSDTTESEMDTLEQCIEAAKEEGNDKDITYLKGLTDSIANGEGIAPRDYVRKYGFAARNIDEDMDYLQGFLFGSEYNLMDVIRFYTGSIQNQDRLIMEALQNPISNLVTTMELPVYFVMGRYDGMTSPKAAENYLDNLGGEGERELILFEEAAHYPQFEEKETFYKWMCNTFGTDK